MNYRPWIIIGAVTGAVALLLLTVIATLAFGTDNPPIPELMALCVADILLGVTALKLLCDAWTMTALDQRTSSYVHGVGDTVDRLASVLPQKDNVRRLG